MAVWSIINYFELFGEIRLDAEFYQLIYEENESIISRFPSVVKLGDITSTFAKGIFDIKADEYVDEGIPFIRISNLKNGIIDEENLAYIPPKLHAIEHKTALRKYDIVLSKTAYPAAALVQLNECNTSQDTIAIRTICSQDFNVYLAVYLNTRFGLLQMERIFQGNIQMHLSLTDAKTLTIPIPNEHFQAEVRQLFEKSIQKREQSKSLYAEAEALLLHELGLDTLDLSTQKTYVANFSETVEGDRLDADYLNPKYTNLISHLKQLAHSTLGNLATFSNGATPKGANYLEEGIPFLRIQNVNKNRLDIDDVVYISEEIHNGALKRSQLKPGDVLITITGRIGTAAVIPDDLLVANMNQHSVRLRLKDKQINPYYLSVFLNSKAGLLQSEREAYGATREALPYYCLERLIVPLASKDLQEQIESKIRAAEKTLQGAKVLLEQAKQQIEQLILGERTADEYPS